MANSLGLLTGSSGSTITVKTTSKSYTYTTSNQRIVLSDSYSFALLAHSIAYCYTGNNTAPSSYYVAGTTAIAPGITIRCYIVEARTSVDSSSIEYIGSTDTIIQKPSVTYSSYYYYSAVDIIYF